MKLSVQLFARARDLVGASPVAVELADDADVGSLRRALAVQYPALAPLGPHLLVAVGQDYARDDHRLSPDVEIACFPPVSGG
jgi:molybdopterin synthase sulfur carrier subunit